MTPDEEQAALYLHGIRDVRLTPHDDGDFVVVPGFTLSPGAVWEVADPEALTTWPHHMEVEKKIFRARFALTDQGFAYFSDMFDTLREYQELHHPLDPAVVSWENEGGALCW